MKSCCSHLTGYLHNEDEHLEQAGYILRSGITPTDIMHIRGKPPFSTSFSQNRKEAPVDGSMLFLAEYVTVTKTGKAF